MCGVTPEIATMDWPFPIELVGMDQAESMVRIVWPGNVPGVRRALVGNWQNHGFPDHSYDIVIGDGGFGFFSYPDDMQKLMAALHKLIKPGGLFVYRHYAQIHQRESPAKVLEDAHNGHIGNFHIFKWRLAMAMQENATVGARQSDVWNAWNNARIDFRKLPQPGWSDRAVSTIDFYKDKQACIYFPTLGEFQSLMNGMFEKVEVIYPTYELGERCPFLVARAKE
jgi:hypothetical protein